MFDLNRLSISLSVSLNPKSCRWCRGSKEEHTDAQERPGLKLPFKWYSTWHRIICVWPEGFQVGLECSCVQVHAFLRQVCLCVCAFPISPTHPFPSYPQTIAGFFRRTNRCRCAWLSAVQGCRCGCCVGFREDKIVSLVRRSVIIPPLFAGLWNTRQKCSLPSQQAPAHYMYYTTCTYRFTAQLKPMHVMYCN